MLLTGSLNLWLRQCFAQLVTAQTGLEIREDEQPQFDSKILARTKALKLPFPEAYYQLLGAKTAESQQEWQHLVTLLTNPESFFLRDKNQFNLLKQSIIPDLIARKSRDRTLRICSAGCSTGEEPYSIAILLKEMIPDLEEWNLTILGVDINPASVEKAKAGIYRQWSFRGVDAGIQQQYFKQIRDQYHIHPQIKSMIEFEVLNLVKDTFPQANSRLREMDLILCRNVFIYFEKAAIATVLQKLYHALQPLGYLITGHAELHGQDLGQFQTRMFSEALVYQRPDTKPFAAMELIRVQSSSGLTEAELLQRAKTLLRQKAYLLAMQQVERAIELNASNPDSYLLMGQILMERNDLTRAMRCCQQAIELHPAPLTYSLLATIYQKQGNIQQAEQILKHSIQLFPEAIAACLDLSQIYQQQSNREQAVEMQRLALVRLKRMHSGQRLTELNNLTVAELISDLETTLRNG